MSDKLYYSKHGIIKDLMQLTEKKEIINFLKNIAIDGKWGAGKTFLVNEIENYVSDKEVKVLVVDIWKYDYFQSIEKIIIINVLRHILSDTNLYEAYRKKLKSNIKKCGMKFLKDMSAESERLSKYINVMKHTKNFFDDVKNNNDYANYSRMLDNLLYESELKGLLKEAKIDVIVLDELDRVLPDTFFNTIKFIKFTAEEIDTVAFVSALNLEQSNSLIKHLYGETYCSEAYFDKIYKRVYNVNNISIDKSMHIYRFGSGKKEVDMESLKSELYGKDIFEFDYISEYIYSYFYANIGQDTSQNYGFNDFELREFERFFTSGLKEFNQDIKSLKIVREILSMTDQQYQLHFKKIFSELIMNVYYLEILDFNNNKITQYNGESFNFKINVGGMTNQYLEVENVIDLYTQYKNENELKRIFIDLDMKTLRSICYENIYEIIKWNYLNSE